MLPLMRLSSGTLFNENLVHFSVTTYNKQRRISLKNSRWLMLHNAEYLDDEKKNRLQQLLSVYPELRIPYELKESFRDIYHSGNRYIAEEKFEKWCESIPEELTSFLIVKETVRNWYNEIFNYFDYPYTNAITESVNNLIKSIEKAGRGYTFNVIRAKVLYATKATRKPVYKAKPKRDDNHKYMSYYIFMEDKELVCGSMSNCTELAEIIETRKNLQSSE
ncbi:MAG: transposase [Prevotellaceae bacterium]|nr:transposase [Candidatus Colivivens equi]